MIDHSEPPRRQPASDASDAAGDERSLRLHNLPNLWSLPPFIFAADLADKTTGTVVAVFPPGFSKADLDTVLETTESTLVELGPFANLWTLRSEIPRFAWRLRRLGAWVVLKPEVLDDLLRTRRPRSRPADAGHGSPARLPRRRRPAGSTAPREADARPTPLADRQKDAAE